jgi:hypothetical protein
MPVDPKILRASDDDRDRTASLLREHHAVGRLSAEEFQERLDKTFEAKTLGDLEDLLADLPHIDLYRLPHGGVGSRTPVPGGSSPLAAAAGQLARQEHGRLSPVWQAAWGSWLSFSAVLVVIWTLTGMGYPWFAWIVGPTGLLLLGRWLSGQHPHDHREHGHGHGGPE